VNRLLAALEKTGTLTIGSLRSLYRRQAVLCHPDAPTGSEAAFVRLQAEYDEALRRLLSRQPARPGPRPRTESPREAFLRALYLYSVGYGGRGWQARVTPLIALAAAYDTRLGRLFAEYRDMLLKELAGGAQRTFLLRTHEMLLDSIKTLAWYYETGQAHNRSLLRSYLDGLSQRAGGFPEGIAGVIQGMCRFLRREAAGAPVSLVTIRTTETMTGRRR
jgi:hypothetical protein